MSAKAAIAVSVLSLAALLAGCTNPDAERTQDSPSPSSPQNPGEPAAPAPASAQAQRPAAVQATAERALSAFAQLYVNWNYRTLSERQGTLARISVGPARLSERQAAARSASDSTLKRGHIYNSGQVVSIARERRSPGWWVIVTRERTGGGAQYAGLPTAYHVTRARLAAVGGGYAVEQWLPQS